MSSAGAAALSAGVGLLVVSLSYAAGRAGHDGVAASVGYWLGQVLIVAPVAIKLLSRQQLSARDSRAVVGVLVVAEYLIKVFYSPLAFTFPDELEHWRSTQDIMLTGHLFTPNYSLPISPDYPGLENVTASLASLTGLSIFPCGLIVIGLCHLLFVALLYALFQRISRSPRVAGVGCLVYAMNPHFQSFDSMFIYQTLALLFLALTLYAVLRLSTADRAAGTAGWWVIALVSIATTTVSHHVTSYALVLLLAIVAAISVARDGWRRSVPRLVALGVALVAVIGWLLLAAPRTLSYLSPAFSDMASMLSGISSSAGGASPAPAGSLADRAAVMTLILVLAILLPAGWARVSRRRGARAWTVSLALASMSYYAVLVVRLLSADGAELAGRAFTFVFIPVAYVAALAAVHLALRGRRSTFRSRARAVVAGAIATVLFAGGIASGWPPYWERLPGAYQVGGFERSVSPEGVAAANWTRTALGPGNRFGVDLGNSALLGAYGDQDSVRDASSLFYARELGPAELSYLRTSSVRYLFVDRRLARALPVSGRYFPVDPYDGRLTTPIPLGNLDKFDAMRGVDRLYDSGDIAIYDLAGVADAR